MLKNVIYEAQLQQYFCNVLKYQDKCQQTLVTFDISTSDIKIVGSGRNIKLIIEPFFILMQHDDHVPTTTVEFVRQWRPLDICDRLLLLKLIGAQNVGQLVKSEIPVGILGEILQALLAFPSNTPDIVFVVRLLDSLTEAKR